MTSSTLLYLLSPLIFLGGLLFYFRLAEKYKIIDKPNERSSHSTPTVRGGGIIFVLAIFLFALENNFSYGLFLLGFLGLSTISFMDDIRQMPKRWRLGIQLIAVILLIFQITEGDIAWWQWGVFTLLFVSSINFYNFMDGINGITAFYSLVMLGSFLYLQQNNVLVVEEALIILPILAILVFSFFNARKKARSFAGDVGSISLAFVVVFLLGLVCWQEQNLMYLWLLGVYGVDAVLTIIQRVFLGQNILQGHRLHLYQLMANEGGLPHVLVSFIYAMLQALLNIFIFIVIIPGDFNLLWVNLAMALFFVSVYVPIKYGFSKKAEKASEEQRKAQSIVS